MILAVLVLPLHVSGNVRLFQTSFGPLQELVAKSPRYARENARPAPVLAGYMQRVDACFSPASTDRRLLSIRLAVSHGGEWLFVDERGTAKNGSQWGRFDVLAWETHARSLPKESGVHKSPLIDLTVQNQTSSQMKVFDAAGFERAAIAANGHETVRTWFGSHRIQVAGQTVGVTDRLFKRATAARGARATMLLSPPSNWNVNSSDPVAAKLVVIEKALPGRYGAITRRRRT